MLYIQREKRLRVANTETLKKLISLLPCPTHMKTPFLDSLAGMVLSTIPTSRSLACKTLCVSLHFTSFKVLARGILKSQVEDDMLNDF